MPEDPPLVVCVTPFFGRVSLLANVLGCFESQDYPNAILLVSNDTGINIELKTPARTIVMNQKERFPTLGGKRQHMLNHAISLGARYVAHWDDDDFYMPSYLREGVAELEKTNNLACRPSIVGFGTNEAPISNNLWDGRGLRVRLDPCHGTPYDSFFMYSATEHYADYLEVGVGENLPFRYKADDLGRWSFYEPKVAPNCCYGWFRQIPHATNQAGGFQAGPGELWRLGGTHVQVASPVNFPRVLEALQQAFTRPKVPAAGVRQPGAQRHSGRVWNRNVRR